MTRQEANRKIISRLAALNEQMGDQRFGQLLVNADVTVLQERPDDRVVNTISYHEESTSILERVQKACERLFYGR